MQCLSKKPSMPYTQNELDLVCSSNTVHLSHTIAILNNTLPPKALPQKKQYIVLYQIEKVKRNNIFG